MSRTSIILFPYYFMLVIGMMLPSDGSHGLLAPKSLAFIGSTFCIGIYFITSQRLNKRQLMLVCFLLCALSTLLVWFSIGIDQSDLGMSSAIDQLKLFILTIATVILTLYIVSEKLATPQKILRILIYSNFAYSLGKVTVVVLHLLGVINIFSLLERMGIRFMTMGIVGSVSRLQTSVDIITPFLLIFVLQSTPLRLNFSKKFRIAFCLISTLAIFLSFSRFLMFVGFIGCVGYWLSLSIPRIIKVVLIGSACVALAVAVIGVGTVFQIVEQRFFSTANYHSDLTREEQIDALMTEYDSYPMLGKGIGGYVPSFIRDGTILHSYEVQWVAFLMQFGALGLILLFVPFGIIAYRLVFPYVSRVRLGFLAVFGLWMFSGLTNPFMISLTSGIVYSMFLLAADILDRNTKGHMALATTTQDGNRIGAG